MTKLYGIKISVSMIFGAFEIVRKCKEFDDIADSNTDVKWITYTFIYQIAKEIKNRKWFGLIIVRQYLWTLFELVTRISI